MNSSYIPRKSVRIRKGLCCGVIAASLVLIGCGGSKETGPTNESNGASQNNSSQSAGSSGSQAQTLTNILGSGQCDKNSTADTYTASIGDISKMAYIYPMGGMTTTHITPIDHIYIYYPEQSNELGKVPNGTYQVTSPADGTIVSVENFQTSNNYPYPDYRVIIQHSCNLYSVFIHIGEVQGAAKEALDAGRSARVAVKAGAVIADDSYSPGFDFSTFDQRVKLDFANPDSYKTAESWKPYTANPFSYFPSEIKAQLGEKSPRTQEPLDGKIDWDKAGSAQGNWYVKDTNGYAGVGSKQATFENHGKIAHGYWDTHLAMAPDAVDPSAYIFSIGDWDGCPCQFMSKGNSVDPSRLTAASGTTAIELVESQLVNPDGSMVAGPTSLPKKGAMMRPSTEVVGLLAVRVNADGTLTVEKRPDLKEASTFTGFTEKAVTYVR